jgi:hypothetical protein
VQEAERRVPRIELLRALEEAVSHRTEPRGDEAIAPLPTIALLGHEIGGKQDADMLGDGWAAHREMSRNRVDGAVGFD